MRGLKIWLIIGTNKNKNKNEMERKRYKLGILFYFSPQWMGGIIYIINIIKTLGFLEDREKPSILIFYKPELKRFVDEIKYPYLNVIEWSFPSIVKGNIKSLLLRKNVFIEDILKNYSLDAIYPFHDFPVRSRTNVKLVAWYADLQHKYYPEFFPIMQILGRNIRSWLMLKNNDDLVVSSQDVMDDFARFYKLRKDLNIHIFHFVSVIDDLEEVKFNDLKAKYNLPDKYFLVSNQFHKHKNHRILLLSLAKLKGKGVHKNIVFTGKLPDASDSPYLAELHSIIKDSKLQDQVIFLGVISRNDQLQIMKHSQAIIQPSLFEGWSTVIEDAKSLQVPVVASSLRVNIEQLGKSGVYFDPHNPDELSLILMNYPERNLNDLFYEDYSDRMKVAAKTLLKIFSNTS
jgi:glycosyltransferase involved in cell wall biosynthesis